ncbi:hypothetical protein BJY04DRAFT_209055 [Aspergillus karnatakaensis]|uniref:glycoside hydrolase family 140 protein n=1 Tax=Aspergillus karnatakaensis TaxID=1810916 RepID=UPI003CCD565E
MIFRLTLLYTVLLSLRATLAWDIPAEYAITPSPNGRFFQQLDGTPFFWQADTAWLLFHRLNYSEAETYLSDRASKGFTMVLAVAFTQAGINSSNRNGDLPFIDEDLENPNEAYWEHVDAVVELAWKKGIRICMVPTWGKYVHDSENRPGIVNTTTARPFGHFLGNRYPYLPKTLTGDTNPYWQNKTAIRHDYSVGGAPPRQPVTDWSPIYDALAAGIVAGERAAILSSSSSSHKPSPPPWHPLLTIHPTNQWFEGGPLALASSFFGDRDWLTLDASQSGHADFPPNPPIPWWNCRRGWETVEIMYAAGSKKEGEGGRVRPVIDNEPHYENRYNNGNETLFYWRADDVRVGGWQAPANVGFLLQVFSGAAGLTYGANAIQQTITPGLFENDGSGPSDYWLDDLSLPGSSQMQWVQKAVLDRGKGTFSTRVPAQEIIVGDAGSDDERVTATRDSRGGWIMVYTPTGEEFAIDTRGLKGCEVQASWFDPLSGEYSEFGYVQCERDKGVRRFSPPRAEGHQDWVLVLDVK